MVAETKNKSRLLDLLCQNAYGPGLTAEEDDEVRLLITKPEYGPDRCWVCKMNGVEAAAIYDTGICQNHNYYALLARK